MHSWKMPSNEIRILKGRDLKEGHLTKENVRKATGMERRFRKIAAHNTLRFKNQKRLFLLRRCVFNAWY